MLKKFKYFKLLKKYKLNCLKYAQANYNKNLLKYLYKYALS